MRIELVEITVKDLTTDFEDNQDDGVFGYHGKLDIRPPFQREFVYGEKERDAVIDTVSKGFPLNIMYWAVKDDENYEIIDGQQRTLSICQYINGDFSFVIPPISQKRYFHNLNDDEKEKILNYGLTIYKCSGNETEKLEWFKTINIAGKVLTNQELKNAVYAGSWVTDAKRHFSKRGCPAHGLAEDYLSGSYIRQDYLETVIKWISNDQIEDYMGSHKDESNADEIWKYFESVIEWLERIFPNKRKKMMQGVQWGALFNTYKDNEYNAEEFEVRIQELILDDDVKNSGIYPYLLTNDQKYLSIRSFSDAQKQKLYQKQNGNCNSCGDSFDITFMEADHITPWHEGGKTNEENCQILCKDCNRRKSGN